MKRSLLVMFALVLASCTPSDQEHAKQKVKEAGRELQHDAQKATQEIKRESEEVKREAAPKLDKATRELKQESDRASKKIKDSGHRTDR
jgi:cell division protein ZapA (FtsZ GTPase activity inhibitor)